VGSDLPATSYFFFLHNFWREITQTLDNNDTFWRGSYAKRQTSNILRAVVNREIKYRHQQALLILSEFATDGFKSPK